LLPFEIIVDPGALPAVFPFLKKSASPIENIVGNVLLLDRSDASLIAS